ncbi:MAG: ribosomal protein S18-alanine N-acetyltransferase [Thermoplasmatota archaeon]
MYIIRQVGTDDLYQVIELVSRVLTEKYTPHLFLYFYESFPWAFWVAEHNKQIVGFTVGVRVTQKKGRILMLGVDEKHRKNGIGSRILLHVLDEFKSHNIQQVELEVQTSNTNAIRFYSYHHFTIVERIEKFYENGEDAFIMRWDVSGNQ